MKRYENANCNIIYLTYFLPNAPATMFQSLLVVEMRPLNVGLRFLFLPKLFRSLSLFCFFPSEFLANFSPQVKSKASSKLTRLSLSESVDLGFVHAAWSCIRRDAARPLGCRQQTYQLWQSSAGRKEELQCTKAIQLAENTLSSDPRTACESGGDCASLRSTLHLWPVACGSISSRVGKVK
jgi:hypothetical protein